MNSIFANFLLVAGVLLFLLIFIASIDYVLKNPRPRDEEEDVPAEETQPEDRPEPVAVRREEVKPVGEAEAQPRRRPGRPRKYTVH